MFEHPNLHALNRHSSLSVRRGRWLGRRAALLLAVVAGGAIVLASSWHPAQVVAARNSVTILGPKASSLDPVAQWDAGSAEVVSQVFESLTAVDSAQRVQPALAESWVTSADGKTITFHLRSGLKFSNGSKLTASDVVKSWLRALNPKKPSQLAPLIDAVAGARAYRQGKGAAADVGIKAPNDRDVVVSLSAATSDFAAIVSSPTFAVVPGDLDSRPADLQPPTFVGSGAYVVSDMNDSETILKANPNYWAGKPAIGTVYLLSQVPGSSGTAAAFQAGKLDYAPIAWGDATWIAYDKTLGPSLRLQPSPSVEYYGFNTLEAPFDNVHVRRAFEYGIDWRRLVALSGDPTMLPATGLVPEGIVGHSQTDFGPRFDLAKAKSELAAAGYPSGSGFPRITLTTGGGANFVRGIVAQLHQNLGIDIDAETLDGSLYNDALLSAHPPQFWQMGWVADYPGAYDFLGILLGDGQENNFGHWSNPQFEAALAEAQAASSPAAQQAAYDKVQQIVQDQAPVIPADFGAGYALSAPGLLGAIPNGAGFLRYAGLSWAGNQ